MNKINPKKTPHLFLRTNEKNGTGLKSGWFSFSSVSSSSSKSVWVSNSLALYIPRKKNQQHLISRKFCAYLVKLVKNLKKFINKNFVKLPGNWSFGATLLLPLTIHFFLPSEDEDEDPGDDPLEFKNK